MRALVAAGVALLVLALLFVRWREPTKPALSISTAAPRVAPTSASPKPTPTPAATAAPRVTRDLLRYEELQAVNVPSARVPPPIHPTAPPPVLVPPAQRLVGFVRRRGTLCAALVLPGNATVVALAAGESSANYSVLEVDEELGVRLRTPEGNELLLPPPR
jgi:hypothetical protein